ncbi:hypothetical protein ACQY0O_005295 [Thecaphora frezii]
MSTSSPMRSSSLSPPPHEVVESPTPVTVAQPSDGSEGDAAAPALPIPPQRRFSINADDGEADIPARNDSPSLYSGPSHARSAKRRHAHAHAHVHHAHAFPDRADSLRDVAVLAKLVDYRSNWYEDHRLSAQEIRERTKSLGWRKASAVAAFYERQNEILDGWREVDEILDSRFPEEVMRRFAIHDEATKRRQSSLDRKASRIRNGRLPGDSTDSEQDAPHRPADGRAYHRAFGPNDDLEGAHDALHFNVRGSKPLNRSLSEKAVSALSGFWFSTGSSTPDRGDVASVLERGHLQNRRASGPFPKGGEQQRLLDSDHAEEDGYKEDEEEGDEDEDEDDANGRPRRHGKRKHRGSRAAPRSRRGGRGGYGAIDATANRSATELYDRIREEVWQQELKRSESSATLSISQQRQAGIASARSGSPTVRDSARQIENIPEYGTLFSGGDGIASASANSAGRTDSQGAEAKAPSAHLRPAEAEGSLHRSHADERRSRPFSTHSAERQALLDAVPNRDKEEEASRAVQFAININLLVNVLLLAGKGIAVVSSNSVSLIASFVDSALDLLSTIIIFGTSKAIAYRSWRTFYKYPVGKKRLEPLGVVIFSVLMVASFCQVLIESVQRLAFVLRTGQEDPESAAALPWVGTAFMLATIGVKTAMWLLYRTSKSSSVRAVAQDAENDVVFNLLSLTFPLIGSKLRFPSLDPLGGIVLSVYIIYEWLHTLLETVQKLSGASASSEQVSKCIYLVTRFNSVRSVSAFELYHAGDECIAEVDVILPQSISLKEAHDLGEIITYCTESVEGVERAYIHLDYNVDGQAGHITTRG